MDPPKRYSKKKKKKEQRQQGPQDAEEVWKIYFKTHPSIIFKVSDWILVSYTHLHSIGNNMYMAKFGVKEAQKHYSSGTKARWVIWQWARIFGPW